MLELGADNAAGVQSEGCLRIRGIEPFEMKDAKAAMVQEWLVKRLTRATLRDARPWIGLSAEARMETDFDGFADGAPVGPGDRASAQRVREPTASAGFGSPGTDFTVKRIDLDDALIRHPQATFVMRAAGDAMVDAGIWDGDILVVDRSITACHGHVIIAKLDGELVCRRLVTSDGVVAL